MGVLAAGMTVGEVGEVQGGGSGNGSVDICDNDDEQDEEEEEDDDEDEDEEEDEEEQAVVCKAPSLVVTPRFAAVAAVIPCGSALMRVGVTSTVTCCCE